MEEVTDEKESNFDELEISEEELAQSIFVPDEFVVSIFKIAVTE